MAMPWPEDLGSGTVLWDLGFMKADNDDEDRSPQLTAGTGITVNFSPDVSQAVRYNGVDGNKTIMPLLSQGIINEEGLLCTMKEDGTPDVVGVVLPATDSETMTPRDWTYTVTVLDNRIIINRFSISLATGAEIDLADYAPVDSSGGTHIVTETETANRAEQARDEALEFRDDAQEAFEKFTWPVQVQDTPPESTDVIWVNPDEPAGTSSDWALRAEAAAATLGDVGGLHVDTSAGVKVSVGDHVIHYDSGWSQLTRDNIRDGIMSGEVHIRRTLDGLYLLFLDAVLQPGSGSLTLIGGLPQSWRPSSNYRDAGQVGLVSDGFARQWIQHYGSAITWLGWQRVSNGDAGNDRPEDGLSGMLTIPPRSDDPLPTSLIGLPL